MELAVLLAAELKWVEVIGEAHFLYLRSRIHRS